MDNVGCYAPYYIVPQPIKDYRRRVLGDTTDLGTRAVRCFKRALEDISLVGRWLQFDLGDEFYILKNRREFIDVNRGLKPLKQGASSHG